MNSWVSCVWNSTLAFVIHETIGIGCIWFLEYLFNNEFMGMLYGKDNVSFCYLWTIGICCIWFLEYLFNNEFMGMLYGKDNVSFWNSWNNWYLLIWFSNIFLYNECMGMLYGKDNVSIGFWPFLFVAFVFLLFVYNEFMVYGKDNVSFWNLWTIGICCILFLRYLSIINSCVCCMGKTTIAFVFDNYYLLHIFPRIFVYNEFMGMLCLKFNFSFWNLWNNRHLLHLFSRIFVYNEFMGMLCLKFNFSFWNCETIGICCI